MRLEDIQQARRNMGNALFWYVVIAFPLLAFGVILTWGHSGATFLACLITFYGMYHFWDGFKYYRWLRNEENRIRRTHALAGERVEQEGGE